MYHHRRSTSRAAPSCGAWARRSRCRSSTRWCRPGRAYAKAAAAARARRGSSCDRDGARRRPAARRSASQKNLWAPAATGRDFDLIAEQPVVARAVPQVPDDRQQHRRAHGRSVRAAGDRRRPLPLERGVPHAVAPEADAGLRRLRRHVARSALRADTSGRTRRFRRCSSASRTSIRPAAAPTTTPASTPTRSAGRRRREPLPMIRDPRVAFDQLFGAGSNAGGARRAPPRRPEHPRLDHRRSRRSSSASSAPADRARLDKYLDDIREIERRIQAVEARNTSGEARELPEAPVGVPDSFDEHMKLMFDLQVLAFAVRHDARLLVQDGPRRVEPRVSGERRERPASIPASHHGEREDRHSSTSTRSTATTSACCRTSSTS